jgi:hypothetical protein
MFADPCHRGVQTAWTLLKPERVQAELATVDQISKPVMIALAAVLCFGCLWVVALRPSADKAASPPAASAPASTAATGTPNTGAAVSGTSASHATRGASDSHAARRAQRVLKALADHKTVVLLFWNGRSADDRAARRAVAHVDRKGGAVVVAVERLSELGAYAPITNGVRIAQSPTTLVIDSHRRAQAIAGYTVTSELDQAVADARGRG